MPREKVDLDALRARAVQRYGERVAVAELGGRVWVLAVPAQGFRKLWQVYKASLESADPTTKADAQVQLARSLLVPLEGEDVKGERAAFDELGDRYPALLDVLAAGAEGLALGPLPMRVAAPPPSSAPDDATPTSPPTP